MEQWSEGENRDRLNPYFLASSGLFSPFYHTFSLSSHEIIIPNCIYIYIYILASAWFLLIVGLLTPVPDTELLNPLESPE